MDNLKISVILPVYNVAIYLERCIDSVLNQTYTNLEIIIIDDGSTDNSSEICDKYESRDSRVIVFHKQNGGPSSARNFGMRHVTGDYVSFIDSDDWIQKDFYESMMSGLLVNADIINANYSIEIDSKIVPHFDNVFEGLYEGNEIKKNFVIPLLKNGRNMQVWTNLYRMDFLKQLNLKFESEKEIYAEDDLFNIIAYNSCRNIYKIKTTSYIHRIVSNSLSQSYREGYFKMQLRRRQLKVSYLISVNQHELLNVINESQGNEIASALFKESLCGYSKAIKNIKEICEFDSREFPNGCIVTNKFKILYKLGRLKLYFLIVTLSKELKLLESIYRKYIFMR